MSHYNNPDYFPNLRLVTFQALLSKLTHKLNDLGFPAKRICLFPAFMDFEYGKQYIVTIEFPEFSNLTPSIFEWRFRHYAAHEFPIIKPTSDAEMFKKHIRITAGEKVCQNRR